MKSNNNASADNNRQKEHDIEERPQERRRQQRVRPPVLSALLIAGDERSAVNVVDISLTGARILNAPSGVDAGELVQLAALLHGDDTIIVRAMVVHATCNEAHCELGIHFDADQAGQVRALKSYILAHLDREIGGDDVAAAA